LIKTPVGNFYHGADFKFDFTPVDGKRADLQQIAQLAKSGVTCLLSDSLGSQKTGFSPSEADIARNFESAFSQTKGKVFVTTYSSNISRLNQAIAAGLKLGRKICFVGRSLLRSRDVARSLSYMNYPQAEEIKPSDVKMFPANKLLILVAGSQAQEDSALVRIAYGEDDNIKIEKDDTVVFSADQIPGNETSIYALIDTIAKKGARVVYPEADGEGFHVSGHGYREDLKLLISLVKPRFLLPIGGTIRHMAAYRDIAVSMGYKESDIILPENGEEVVFTKDNYRFGKKISLSNIFIDEVTGEKIESYVVIDRQRIAKEGILVVITEIDSNTARLVGKPDIIARGFALSDREKFSKKVFSDLSNILRKKETKNRTYYKKLIERVVENILYKQGQNPLIIPVVIEV
jgi:ribonuclease J